MTNSADWLLALPEPLLPAGIGTLAAYSTGVYVEAADDAEGRWVTWADIAYFVLPHARPDDEPIVLKPCTCGKGDATPQPDHDEDCPCWAPF